jgi:hypothetical protein
MHAESIAWAYNKGMPEKIPSPEFSEEEQKLIEALWKGESGSEERFRALVKEREDAIRSDPRGNMELHLHIAKLCHAAGAWRIAWDYLESVREQAHGHGESAQDLFDAAMAMMDQIEAEGEQEK